MIELPPNSPLPKRGLVTMWNRRCFGGGDRFESGRRLNDSGHLGREVTSDLRPRATRMRTRVARVRSA